MNDRPFDRVLDPGGPPRQQSGRLFLVFLGVVGFALLVLVVGPFNVLGGGGGGSSSAGCGATPKPPDGFEAVSKQYCPEKPKGTNGPYNLTLNLLQPTTDGRNLAIYANNGGKWDRLAGATLTNQGTAAVGQVPEIPAIIAVLRRTSGAVAVSGRLPAGAQPDPAAMAVLGTINPGDYTPNPDGTLNGNPTQLPAVKGSVAPTIRALEQKDADAVNTILSAPATRDAHIAALVALANQPGNTGVDIDYERLPPARKPDFTAFITALADKLHQANKTLSVTLPTPVKTGVSWDTGAYDWDELTKRADQVRLMPEPDPSQYYQRMTDVLSYLKGKSDLRRVSLVISRQSYAKGSDGLQTISLKDALSLASTIEVRTQAPIQPNSSVVVVGKNIFQDDGATGVKWDDAALAVSFAYPSRGGQRTVWLENSFSLGFRLDLAKRFGLGGVVIDDITADPNAANIWSLVGTFGDTGNVTLVQPNGTLLRPTWTVQAGSSEPGAKGNVVWKAPAQPGTYDVSLIVSDGIIRAAQKVSLTVGPGGTAGTSATPSTTGTPGTPRPTTPGAGTTATPGAGSTGTPRPTTTGTVRPN